MVELKCKTEINLNRKKKSHTLYSYITFKNIILEYNEDKQKLEIYSRWSVWFLNDEQVPLYTLYLTYMYFWTVYSTFLSSHCS